VIEIRSSDGDREGYSYDLASRLAGIDYERSDGEQIGSLEYARNAVGEVTTVSGSEARTNLPEPFAEAGYDAANELTKLGGESLGYDADGNLTSAGGSTYTWNDRGELAGIAQGSSSRGYGYDPFGRRAGKDVNGSETKYLYDGENVAQETTGGATAQLLDGLGLDERFARTTGAGTASLLTDELGSTVALAGAAGTPTTEYTYDPFGLTTASGAASSNPFQYTGRESEGDGLQFNRARYYSPATARFISADPAGMAGSGVDLYQYAESDPVDEIDPMGLESWLEGVGNGITGAVDTATGGLTGDIRGWAGLAQPNMSSASYQIGSDAGLLAATLTGDEDAAAPARPRRGRSRGRANPSSPLHDR
jgi:RHS repeat-associated protein